MMKKTQQWIIDTVAGSAGAGTMMKRAHQWIIDTVPGTADAGTAADRVFSARDGKWYFWTRSERGAARRLEGPFADRDGALRVLDRHVRDSLMRRGGLRWPRAWSPMRLRRRPDSCALPGQLPEQVTE